MPETTNSTNEVFNTQWILHYKAVHNVSSANFMGPSNLEATVKIAKEFCEARKWRFIQVRKMFIDIKAKPQSEEEREKYR